MCIKHVSVECCLEFRAKSNAIHITMVPVYSLKVSRSILHNGPGSNAKYPILLPTTPKSNPNMYSKDLFMYL